MDDFFETNDDSSPTVEVEQAEVDPAADFLSQQQNEIADLENEVLGTTDQAPFQQTIEPAEDFVVVNHEPTELVGGDANTFDEKPDEGFEQMDPSQAYAAIAAADARLEQLRAEPEKIRQWREEQTKYLNEKDSESERTQQEWISQARKDLEDWDRNRMEQLEKTKEGNRIAESEFIKERDHPSSGSEWDQVSKLCDFNPKVGKGTKDVTRMRSTLLQLKQNPRSVSVTVK